ncbi:phytanoyl-CoA dioxygenase family protein [Chondromyces crocatus]|uniref:Phytanoyl-CoA dioxygenase n=1 Tax=Chondromyces crocatus TaxID=52 RepID=A0A0K1EMK0_CHOCO|nr:phytanoyl-CoA dioxygenase family protein [Chondromyces crocatus]AKT42051.1 uncharacterized protein CMC5_062740 [Chondromyces crocatus]
MTLTTREIDRYQRDGFLKVPQVLSPAEVSSFLDEARAMLHRHDRLHWPSEQGLVMDWGADAEIMSTVMRGLTLHPVITSVAEQLAGRPLRLFKSELLRKACTGSATTPPRADGPHGPRQRDRHPTDLAGHRLHGRRRAVRPPQALRRRDDRRALPTPDDPGSEPPLSGDRFPRLR